MRLLRIGQRGSETPAVLDGEDALDVSGYTPDFDSRFFASGGLQGLERYVGAQRDALPRLDLHGQRIGAPIARPHHVICIGLNYAKHAQESGMTVPNEPVIFTKAPNTVVGPNDGVLLPPNSHRSDWEVELAVVIGATARYLADEAAAARHIAGFAISNDLSEREYQLERGGQWVKGKSCETFNPLGPWLVTTDEIVNPHSLELKLAVNGQTMQASTTSDMVFHIKYLVWYLSQFMVLEPGDLINTGTPEGVGMGQDPPRYLKEGDVMELEIEGLGRQQQAVVRASPDEPSRG